jgi:hypothetical protein
MTHCRVVSCGGAGQRKKVPLPLWVYWGALPWVGLQMIMVVLVIAFPITVTALLDKPLNVDLNQIKIDVPQMELPPLDFGPPPKQ